MATAPAPAPATEYGFRVIQIIGLGEDVTDEALLTTFETVGPILRDQDGAPEIFSLVDPETRKGKGQAIIVYANPAHAARAVSLFDGQQVLGTCVHVTLQDHNPAQPQPPTLPLEEGETATATKAIAQKDRGDSNEQPQNGTGDDDSSNPAQAQSPRSPKRGPHSSPTLTHSNNHVIQRRPGDWICERCDNLNFARRVFCHRCGAPKPVVDEPNKTPPPNSSTNNSNSKSNSNREGSNGPPLQEAISPTPVPAQHSNTNKSASTSPTPLSPRGSGGSGANGQPAAVPPPRSLREGSAGARSADEPHPRDPRDPHPRDILPDRRRRDPRDLDPRDPPRGYRDGRDFRDGPPPREFRDHHHPPPRDFRDPRDLRESRDPRDEFDPRRDPRYLSRRDFDRGRFERERFDRPGYYGYGYDYPPNSYPGPYDGHNYDRGFDDRYYSRFGSYDRYDGRRDRRDRPY